MPIGVCENELINELSFSQTNTRAIASQEANIEKDQLYKQKPLEKIFHSASARIVDFLLVFREFDYSEAEIARKTHLTSKTVGKEIPTLLEEGVIRLTRKSGRSNMYKINDSKKVQGLIQYIDGTIESSYDRLNNS